MSLVDGHKHGIVQKHTPGREEMVALLAVADREIADAGVAGVSADGHFRAAYNAVLSLATAALHASGYRTPANVSGHHARTIQSLTLTLRVQAALTDWLDVCRKKRNISTYDVAGAISEEEVKAILHTEKWGLSRDTHSAGRVTPARARRAIPAISPGRSTRNPPLTTACASVDGASFSVMPKVGSVRCHDPQARGLASLALGAGATEADTCVCRFLTHLLQFAPVFSEDAPPLLG